VPTQEWLLTDPDDGVRALAVRLVDRWIEGIKPS
jgi:hypothetical protein